MASEITVAVLALIGTLSGSALGIVASAKLTNWRLKSLEDEVREHNNFARRMPVVEEQIKGITHRLEDLEKA
ncbi:conserved exported hypothetical protein [uncultured Eubacteriales bacterium]|uniref:Uncharacterized protein n=1 Tax=uncultured Eubacteriales bacterium TaxID=172733 RepID=A0A212JSS3_9FIRM|nr:conserved exported hypothetical protein [uncultured Eubacteriales bacterium]